MSAEISKSEEKPKKIQVRNQGGSGEAVYGLGLFGAWYFFISRATTFQEGVVGFFKGLFWPAILVYELLVFLHKE